ncbi:MAG: hypothetical protein HY243_14505 [Proteobacteria bacterium]|nr:hypothetical protein [Pseudomonadota bacterium]
MIAKSIRVAVMVLALAVPSQLCLADDDVPIADTVATRDVTRGAVQKITEFASTKIYPRCNKLDSIQAMTMNSEPVPADIQTQASPSKVTPEVWEARLCGGRFLFMVAFWTDASGHAQSVVRPMGPVFGP